MYVGRQAGRYVCMYIVDTYDIYIYITLGLPPKDPGAWPVLAGRSFLQPMVEW